MKTAEIKALSNLELSKLTGGSDEGYWFWNDFTDEWEWCEEFAN